VSERGLGRKLGYTSGALTDANRAAIGLLEEIRGEYETERTPVVISGCVGPRGDGYVPDRAMSEQEAAVYHREQIETFAGSAADMVGAMTMTYAEEAVGIARAAQRAAIPVAISFTVETDGRLPTGQDLRSAIEQVDGATSGYPAYYMVNCAHPTHFEPVLSAGAPWVERIRGLRANASRMSHAELNDSPDLDIGDAPLVFGIVLEFLAVSAHEERHDEDADEARRDRDEQDVDEVVVVDLDEREDRRHRRCDRA